MSQLVSVELRPICLARIAMPDAKLAGKAAGRKGCSTSKSTGNFRACWMKIEDAVKKGSRSSCLAMASVYLSSGHQELTCNTCA